MVAKIVFGHRPVETLQEAINEHWQIHAQSEGLGLAILVEVMLCSNWKITCFQCFQFQFHSRHLCDPTGFRHLSNGMPLTNLWRCGGIVLYHWVVSSRVQSSPEKGSLSWWQWHGRKMWSESVHTYARGCACLHRLLLRSAFKDRRSFQLPAFNQIWICCVVSHQWVISLIVIVWFWLIRFVIYIPSSLFMWVWCGVQCGCVWCGFNDSGYQNYQPTQNGWFSY